MGKLFQELKRRNVYKVATLYVVASWVLLQVTETVFPIFDISTDLLRPITLALLVGFLPVLVLTWIYEYSAEGFRKTQADKGAAAPVTFGTDIIVIFLLLVVVGFTAAERFMGVRSEPGATSNSALSSPISIARSSINLGALELMPNGGRADITLSRDGRRLAYFAREDSQWKLYARELDQLVPRMIVALTDNITMPNPTFSPDGEELVYYNNGSLKKIAFNGGTPQSISDTGAFLIGGFGISWHDDGTIIFAGNDASLSRVASTGGLAVSLPIVGLEDGGRSQTPHILPDGKTILATRSRTNNQNQIELIDLESGTRRSLGIEGRSSSYSPTGHIIFIRFEELWAVPFDLNTMELTGDEVRLMPDIQLLEYDYSESGRLIYRPGSRTDNTSVSVDALMTDLVWVDRAGNEQSLGLEARLYRTPTISPDGLTLAMTNGSPQIGTGSDVWTYDLEREILSRGTNSAVAAYPLWSPDSERLIYTVYMPSVSLWSSRKDFTDTPRRITNPSPVHIPDSISPDGKSLVYYQQSDSWDLHILSLDDEFEPRPLLATDSLEIYSEISPNGRWMAYTSDESGTSQIYVRPFPDVESGKSQISNTGGTTPRWNGDGTELFYLGLGSPSSMYAVTTETESDFVSTTPELLFTGEYYSDITGRNYDASNDGQRFLMLKAVGATANATEVVDVSLVMVENWFEELNRLAPTDPQ